MFVVAGTPTLAEADAGGSSFWFPGAMGSLAAVPGEPGWSWLNLYIHFDTSGNFVDRNSFTTGVHSRSDALATGPIYTFASAVFGGRASFGVFAVPGNVGATLAAPNGRSAQDERTTFSDVFYQGTLKWNQGVNNTMVYVTGNIPSGTYDQRRLANLSLGYVVTDAGGAYTYLDSKTGNEFSIASGFSYNFINPYTQYQNGIDFHTDWAASHYLNKNAFIGFGGYFFQQVSGDTGAGAIFLKAALSGWVRRLVSFSRLAEDTRDILI